MNNRALSIGLVVVIGLALIGGAFWLLKGSNKNNETAAPEEESTALKDLPVEQRPYTTLTPRVDGHELHLTVTKLPTDVSSMEYELVYKVSSGVTQGVPGTVKDISGQSTIERDLLLGTCSSGKCRYDEGVSDGTFTLRFRDNKGKLVYKLDTGFKLQQDPTKVTSTDDKFSVSGSFPKGFYVTMGTFGLPDKAPGTISGGPYGVFTKAVVPHTFSGTVTLTGAKTYVYSNQAGDWQALANNKTSVLDTFISTQ